MSSTPHPLLNETIQDPILFILVGMASEQNAPIQIHWEKVLPFEN